MSHPRYLRCTLLQSNSVFFSQLFLFLRPFYLVVNNIKLCCVEVVFSRYSSLLRVVSKLDVYTSCSNEYEVLRSYGLRYRCKLVSIYQRQMAQ